MIWPWGSKKQKQERSEVAEARVEVVAHKRATKRQIESVKEVNKNLNDVLEANGFTLKIFLAAGGHHPKMKKEKRA